MIRFVSIALSLVASLALPSACDRAAPVGRVSIGLSEDVCHDYCLEALRATLFREGDDVLPLGPALQVGCGQTLSFPALPAGERVRATLQAYDITGELLLEGASEPLTIIADGVTEARVLLSAISLPEVDAITPDPVVVVAGPASVTLSGAFGAALGDAGVEVGGSTYTAAETAWTTGAAADAIALSLPLGAGGGPLVVRRCGIGSAPVDLRVIGPTLGEALVTAGPGCAGASARAAVLVDEAVLVAWGCGDGSASVSWMHLHDTLCPLDPGASWSLSAVPDALAVKGNTAWVGGPAGLFSIDLASAGSAPRQVSGVAAVRALAATAGEVFAILAEGRLVRVDPAGVTAVGGFDASLELLALAASSDRMFVAARTTSGEGRLVSEPTGGVVTVTSLEKSDLWCDAPSAIAVSADGLSVALGCRQGGIGLWDVAAESLAFVETGSTPEALAFDDTSDVVFGVEVGGGLAIVDREGQALLHRYAHAARPDERPPLLMRLGGHRLLMPAATAPLAVLTPFDEAGPCAAEPP